MLTWAAQMIMGDRCAGAGWIVKRSERKRVPDAVRHSSCRSAEQGPYQTPESVTVPVLRSSAKRRCIAPRTRSQLPSAQLFQHVGRSKPIRRRADRSLKTAQRLAGHAAELAVRRAAIEAALRQ